MQRANHDGASGIEIHLGDRQLPSDTGYRIRHKLKHRIPVISCIILLMPSAVATDCYQDEEVHFQYRLIRIYEMDAREIIDNNLTCLMPFVPLMRHGRDLICSGRKPDQLL
jgi:hypothetical protein